MKTCILCAIIIVAMTNGACAQNQINHSSLITTYDPGEASLKSPNFTSTGEFTAEDHRAENKGNIIFEGQNPGHHSEFEDNPSKQGLDDIDEVKSNSLLAHDNKINNYQNNRISNTGRYESKSNSESKIKFEGSNDEQETFDYDDGTGEDIVPQERGNKIVFEDDENEGDYLNESEIEVESNPIKFENQHNESHTNKRDSDRNSVTERVVFKDDDNQSQQPIHRKKRKPRRKPGFNGKPTNPGYGYPGNPGVGYHGPVYPGPGGQNAGYPNYPIPGYPAPGHPYPNYNSQYPGMAFPSSAYPSNYPPIGQGYGVYPLPGFQVLEGQRPYVGPSAYPSAGQGDSNGPTGTKYPNQEYDGSPSPVVPQNGQGGSPYAGSNYPYNQGNPVPGYPAPYPYDPYAQYPPQGQSQYRPPLYPGPHQPGYPNGPQRPPRRPKSLTERAVSAVAEALTSIALYDDQQCVPRILCEMAGGSTASSPTLLKASATLQPLLTLLQAYNGVSTSPLYVFGRATVMGITAKGNPSACYRAYPQCPRDPEKLINYLNNHNGGFFRFFGQPDSPQQTQNLEQFYNYLSGQNGLPQQSQQAYGFQKPNSNGLLPQNPYAQSYKYGQNDYKKQFLNRNANSIETEVEARIQNKPVGNILEADSDLNSDESQFTGSKWSFPDEGNKHSYRRDKGNTRKQPERGSITLKFPDDRSDYRGEVQKVTDYTRKEKRIYFPGQNNYHKYVNYYETTTPVNPDEYYFDYKHNFYVKKPKALETDDVVYVVRGNGDPNHPEIIRVKPGQTI